MNNSLAVTVLNSDVLWIESFDCENQFFLSAPDRGTRTRGARGKTEELTKGITPRDLLC